MLPHSTPLSSSQQDELCPFCSLHAQTTTKIDKNAEDSPDNLTAACRRCSDCARNYSFQTLPEMRNFIRAKRNLPSNPVQIISGEVPHIHRLTPISKRKTRAHFRNLKRRGS